MTHTEVKALFEAKLAESKAIIESAKNGQELIIKSEISYCDDKLIEAAEYDEKGQ